MLRRVDDERQAHELVDSGVLDLVLNWEAPPDVVAQAGSERGFTTAADHVKFVTLNLAVPPLDDLHVRRAINFAVARGPLVAGLRQAGVGAAGATHTGLDSEENNLLLAYDPYDASTGDAKKAAAEMANSRYDDNHDGRCDASACETLRLVVLDRAADPVALDLARRFARDVAHIGLQVQVIPQDRDAYGSTYAHPEARIPMRLTDWYKDLTSGSTFFPPLFGSPKTGVTQANGESVLGASSRELRRWGYRITSVPSVDDRITRCLELFFESQLQCWAELDQHLTTEVVPVVPLVSLTTAKITSSRVHSLTFGPAASTPQPSLDRIGLGPQEPVPRSTARPAPVPGIPGAVYRFTITKEDLFRFDRTFDPESVDENTGEVTMFIGNGQWRYIQIADHPIYHPLSAGVYSGSGNRVVFETLAPPPNALKTPPMRWTFRGDSLRFKFLGCGNLNDLDPTAPRLCDDYRTFFEAHPWEKIG